VGFSFFTKPGETRQSATTPHFLQRCARALI